MTIQNINDAKFNENVLKASVPVLLTFRAARCAQSLHMAQVIGEIAKDFDGRVQFFEVDADKDTKSILKKYNVQRLPVSILLENGKPVDFIGGVVSKNSISKMVKRRLSPVFDVNDLDFDSEVLKSSKPVLVHFDAAWCKESQIVSRSVSQVAQKLGSKARFVRVPFGPETARICAQFGVTRVPTLSLFVNGKVKDQIFGSMTGGATQNVKSDNGVKTIEEMLGAVL